MYLLAHLGRVFCGVSTGRFLRYGVSYCVLIAWHILSICSVHIIEKGIFA